MKKLDQTVELRKLAEEGNKIQKCCKSMSPLVVRGFTRWYTWLDKTLHLNYVTSSISRAPMLCSLLMASLMASSDGGCSSLPSTSCSKYTKSHYLRSVIRVTTSISSLHIFQRKLALLSPNNCSRLILDGGIVDLVLRSLFFVDAWFSDSLNGANMGNF